MTRSQAALGAALFWLAVLALSAVNLGQGPGRALLLLGFAAAMSEILWQWPESRRPDSGQATARQLKGSILALLVGVHVAWCLAATSATKPHVIDIGRTTLQASRALLHGLDPYLLPIDPQGGAGLKGFDGYKYGPVMALAYAPLGVPFRVPGLLLTNLLADLGVAWAVGRLAGRIGGPDAGFIARAMYLSLPMIPQQAYTQGVTDLVPVLALLIGLLVRDRSGFGSGLCLGLSIAAKPFPGLIAAGYGFGAASWRWRDRIAYVAGGLAGLSPVALAVAHAGRAVIDNTLLFNLARAPDTTAWLRGQSAEVGLLARAGGLAVLALGAAACWRGGATLRARSGWIVIGVIATILAGAAAHTNYMLWWLPLFCVVLGSTRFRAGA